MRKHVHSVRKHLQRHRAHRFIPVLILVALLAVAAQTGTPRAFVSSEVKFADASPSGMQIVPASCASVPPHEHTLGECSVTTTSHGCTITASPSPAGTGETVTVTWSTPAISGNWPDPSDGNLSYLADGRNLTSSQRVNPISGSLTFTPGIGTYRLSGTYAVNYDPVEWNPPRYSCSVVVANASAPPPQACPAGYHGTYPNCVAPACPAGYHGTYPNCVAPACPTGYSGTPPNCLAPSCVNGYTGVPPCVAPVCPVGYSGTPPNCVVPPAETCPAGYTGTPPNCVVPPAETCPIGYTGTPPNCSLNSPEFCPDGTTGIPPNCVTNQQLCPDGTTGTPPNCVIGTGTGTGGPCVSTMGESCLSVANNCGDEGVGITQCDGSCSASQPTNRLCTAQCPEGYTGTPPNCKINGCPAGYTLRNGRCERRVGCSAVNYCSGDNLVYGDPGDSACPATYSRCSNGCNVSTSACNAGPISSWSVKPTLVRRNDTVNITWGAQNVRSCQIRGISGTSVIDSWTGLTSGSQPKISSPIPGKTIYTISCIGLALINPLTVSNSTEVNIVPEYQER